MRYVTLFPECERVHLKKDVGMLPYALNAYGYETKIVCYDNGNISDELREKYKVFFVDRKHGTSRDFWKYLVKNAKNIDILNLYHITSRRNAMWIVLYKLFNPRGIVHIKLDADYRMLSFVNMHPKSFLGKIKMYVFKKYVDIYTAESQKMTELLGKTWNLSIKYLPNGYFTLTQTDYPLNYKERKYFLTVGRLGTEQKATEVLMEAYAKISDKVDVPLVLVGTIDSEFENYVQAFYDRCPTLKDKVIFKGEVSDELELKNYYDNAVAFVLPSRWESFGLVLLEALDRGVYLIVSDSIPAAQEIGNNGHFCTIVPTDNVDALADIMEKYSQIVDNSVEALNERRKWVNEKYSWGTIAGIMNKYIKEKRNE